MPNEYISPGGPVQKPAVSIPLVESKPVVVGSGAFTRESAAGYE